MNRATAIEAGMAALDRARFPEGDGNLAFLSQRGLDELRAEVTTVIDAALPHLVPQVLRAAADALFYDGDRDRELPGYSRLHATADYCVEMGAPW